MSLPDDFPSARHEQREKTLQNQSSIAERYARRFDRSITQANNTILAEFEKWLLLPEDPKERAELYRELREAISGVMERYVPKVVIVEKAPSTKSPVEVIHEQKYASGGFVGQAQTRSLMDVISISPKARALCEAIDTAPVSGQTLGEILHNALENNRQIEDHL